MAIPVSPHPASYRDPAGFIFEKEAVLYRQVNQVYRADWERFLQSGCYDYFVQQGWLIPHDTIDENLTGSPDWLTTIRPQRLSFISYPWEWSFGMLREAALLTLTMARKALDFEMSLKDATPYNLQWQQGRMQFIDTLSFENYDPLQPWIAYRQFCECFLAPLVLMHYLQEPLSGLFRAYPDGIPLRMVKKLLPRRTRFSLHLFLHIHLHARVAQSGRPSTAPPRPFSRQKMLNLLSSLEILIKRLQLHPQASHWAGYYAEAATRKNYLETKKQVVNEWADELLRSQTIHTAIDLGCNLGEFSQILASKGIFVIATDADAYCIDRLYDAIKTTNEKNICPLVIDIADPSPALGLDNEERSSFTQRARVDLVMVLALIHHLVIGRNISFSQLAVSFQKMAPWLMIEFVPKEDEKVQLMLQQKKDIFPDYTPASFLSAFERYYHVVKSQQLGEEGRVLYWMQRKEPA